ncbi:FAD-dependent oxidoreductase, partial [Ralstonia solanacearum]
MKLDSYWNDSVPALALAVHDLPAQVDVAIVGGGFTGLSAALALARRGASVVVLEAGPIVAPEASGRNGGGG